MVASSSCSSVDGIDFESVDGQSRSPSPDPSSLNAIDEQSHEQQITELDDPLVAYPPKNGGKKKSKKKGGHKSGISVEPLPESPTELER